MSALDRLAAVSRRWPWGGSALPEPSAAQVYEDRLPAPVEPIRREPVRREPVAGANLLKGKGAAPTSWLARSSSALHATPSAGSAAVREWAPWCKECQAPPIDVFTQGNAEYLANKHDALFHGGSWTCEALPATQVAALVAALPNGGAR